MVQALYLHIPFCVSRCRYCDFSTSAIRRDNPIIDAYREAIVRLTDGARSLGLLDSAETAYLGGGTPTMLGAEGLQEVLGTIPAQCSEVSFEANPESLSNEVLSAAVRGGATRVSIGVQSFDDRELRALGRIHSAELAEERVRAAVESGLDVSLDLMCGIPFQTAESWQQSLERALELGIGHVSCYPLQIEDGTAMERLCESGKLPWPDDDLQAELMERAASVLCGGGLHRYEVASYAAPDCACKHNIAYWTGVEYLGLGTSAASMLARGTYDALRRLVKGLPAPHSDTERIRLVMTSSAKEVAHARSFFDLAFDIEELTAREAAAEDLMLGLRMSRGVSYELLERASRVIPKYRIDAAVEAALRRGLVCWRMQDGGALGLAPTSAGWLLGNELYGLFWDLAE